MVSLISRSRAALVWWLAHALHCCRAPTHAASRPRGGPRRCTAGDARPRRTPPRRRASPGTAATAARIRATRSRWPTAYCGRPPPQRCTWVSTGAAVRPTAVAQVGQRRRRPARRRWPAARPPRRCGPARCAAGAGRRLERAAPASRTQSHLAKENVEALIRRPSTGGTRKPEAAVQRRAGRSAARKARVTTAIEAYSIAASSAAADRGEVGEQPGGRARRAWRARRRRRRSLGGRGRADGQHEARRAVRAQLAHRRRRCGRRAPAASALDAGRPIPPASPAKTGTSGSAGGRRAQQRPALASATQLRHGGAGGDARGRGRRRRRRAAARPAGRRPRRRSARRPGRRPRRRRRRGRPAGRGSRRTRARPSADSTPEAASWSRSSGTPISERGSGRSAPRVQIREDAVVGCTTVEAERARPASTPSGRRLSIASAPTSTLTPATVAPAQLAADPVGSPRAPRRRGRAATRSRAAVSPAIPAPTTTTRLPLHPSRR